jgi:hypothetical protein
MASEPHRSVTPNPVIGFASWIVFAVAADDIGWQLAGALALAISVVLTIPDFRGHRLKLLDAASILFFGLIVLMSLFLDPTELSWLERYSGTISTGALGLVVLLSLPVMPFTEQYAREHVPQELWSSPRFKRTNLVLSGAWGVLFAILAVETYVTEATDPSSVLLGWVIPILLVILGFKLTNVYAAQARKRASGSPQASAT